jgi:acyl-CoA synthetase (AMP-forming)/AMP-acid ligase II
MSGRQTVGGLFLAAGNSWPDAPFLIEDGVVLTYAETAQRARVVAGRLQELGVRPGDRVALALRNGWAYAIAYAGVQLTGAVAVLVNIRFTASEIDYVLQDAGVKLTVFDEASADCVPQGQRCASVHQLVAAGSAAAELPGLDRDSGDIANILYTSGTTGRPKGAMQTQANLVFNARTVKERFALTPDDRTLVVAPMFHATGLNSQLLGFCAAGGSCVFQPAFDVRQMLRTLIDNEITFFAGVTAMIHLAIADPAFDASRLSRLRAVIFGGAPVAEAFLEAAAAALPHVQYANVWGMTEATSIVTVALGEELMERPWSVGRAVPGVEVSVEGSAEPDVRGELWIRGPVVTSGYWRNEDATASTFGADGWLRTGDVGRIDGDGYVQVLDRLKDMIIRGGENIYCLEVESVLAHHPAIAEVAVVGVPDEIFGEVVRAAVALRPGTQLELRELREWASVSLADYKLPVELVTTAALPRNASGKVVKDELTQLPATASHHAGAR